MKYQIIIPTFSGHFAQVELALSSFEKFLTDKADIGFYLIVSKHEVARFTELATKFSGSLNITIASLRDLIKEEEHVEVDEKWLLEYVGKFNFQSLKKLYGVKHFGTTSLVLDSEALLVRAASLGKVFEDYRKDPFIIYTSLTDEQIKIDVAHESFETLGKPFQDIWFFEYYYWFFEKEYVDKMFSHIFQATGKSLYENFLCRKPLFEYNLYALYLYLFHKNAFRFIDAGTLLNKYLSPVEFDEYQKALDVSAPSFEYLCWGLTKGNAGAFSKLFRENHMAFFRYDDRRGDASAQAAFVQDNKNIILLTSRMVITPFSVDGYSVPMNFDEKLDAPMLSSKNDFLTRVIKYGRLFARKVKIRFTEIVAEAWYSLELKIRLDKNQMLLRYKPSNRELRINKDLAFDVGAYSGTSLKRLRTLGYKNIIGFEPSPRTFVRLYRKHHNDPNLSFINRAVSDVSEQMIPFYESPEIPTFNTTDAAWFSIPRHAELVHKFKKREVRTITLDEVIEMLNVIPAYIKIDVEGHELSVLKGLHHKPDLLSFEWVSERMESNILALKRVHEIGFTKFYPIQGEGLPDYTAGNEKSFEELLAIWSQPEGVRQEYITAGGNVWCR